MAPKISVRVTALDKRGRRVPVRVVTTEQLAAERRLAVALAAWGAVLMLAGLLVLLVVWPAPWWVLALPAAGLACLLASVWFWAA